MVALAICLCSSEARAQSDPGVRDTLRVASAQLAVGQSLPVAFSVINDETATGFLASIRFVTKDGGFARFDSLVYVGRMADPSVLSWRMSFKKCDGVSPDSLIIYDMRAGSEPLPPGASPVALIYLTGLEEGSLDVKFYGAWPRIILANPDNSSSEFSPILVGATLNVVEKVNPPGLVIPQPVYRIAAGADVEFPVTYSSPAGLTAELTLSQFRDVESSNRMPVRTPTLSSENPAQFSWRPDLADVGIWRAVLTAGDSDGNSTVREVEIQVVSTDHFLMEFALIKKSQTANATGLVQGNLDADVNSEIFVTGNTLSFTSGAQAYNVAASGLSLLYDYDYLNNKIAPQVGYFNSDDYLDVVTSSWSGHGWMIESFRGTATGSFQTGVTDPASGPARGCASGEFNGDGRLDYAVGLVQSVLIYFGDGFGSFPTSVSIAVADTALTLNSADFDGDGRDDLAVGTRKGLSLFLQHSDGVFSPGASYPQEYGSVDIDVTNSGSDFNGDRNFDLCVATPSVGGASSQMMVYFGRGDGTFASSAIRTLSGQILGSAVGDFNGDAELDIAFINGGERYVGILFGDGDGNFVDEVRYTIPDLRPRHIDGADFDLDGDLDLVVAASDGVAEHALFLLTNNDDPFGFVAGDLKVTAWNNAEVTIISPSGRELCGVSNTLPAASTYKRDMDGDRILDSYTSLGAIETGEYIINVKPRPNSAETAFSLGYSLGETKYRLAKLAPISAEGYNFSIFLNDSPVSPMPGGFVKAMVGTFRWQGSGQFNFELATDPRFQNKIVNAVVNGGSYTYTGNLAHADTTTYFWRIKHVSEAAFKSIYAFNVTDAATDVDGNDSPVMPESYSLNQNFPNPFNPTTRIEFYLPHASWVTVRISNLLGETVALLVNEVMPAGRHTIEWDGRNANSQALSSGVYFCRLEAGEFSSTLKMVLLK